MCIEARVRGLQESEQCRAHKHGSSFRARPFRIRKWRRQKHNSMKSYMPNNSWMTRKVSNFEKNIHNKNGNHIERHVLICEWKENRRAIPFWVIVWATNGFYWREMQNRFVNICIFKFSKQCVRNYVNDYFLDEMFWRLYVATTLLEQ